MSENVSIGNIEINHSGNVGTFLKQLGVARVAAMATVALFMVGFFIFLITRFNEPQLSVLYSELEFKDSAEITKKLDGMNIPHEVRADGTVILVPKDQVLKLRMAMAEEGLPTGGTVGYEIFDKGSNLGATNFVQNINHLRAVEGELSRTITALNQVQQARVHLVLPKRKLFARDKAKASASIVIKSRGSLDRGQIKAIQHLVAAAVEDLNPGQVSVVDESGKLLASGSEDENANNPMAGEVAERTRSYERRLSNELEEIVSRIVGDGHVRVRVNAEMDYNRITKSSEVFDPDGRVVRSSNTREENASSRENTGDKSVTVGNELPDSEADKSEQGTAETKERTEEVVNYEISKTNQTEIIEGGRIKRLSVAVLVDGVYANNAQGKPEYKNRAPAEIEKINALVRSAIGFNQERGDVVNITNLQFAPVKSAKLGAPSTSMFNFSKADYFYIAELTITLLISLFFILFVIRPLVKRVLEPEKNELVIDLVEHDTSNAIADGDKAESTANAEHINRMEDIENQLAENKTAQTIETAKMSGQIHAEAIKQIGSLVQNNPKEATAVIRQWISNEEMEAA